MTSRSVTVDLDHRRILRTIGGLPTVPVDEGGEEDVYTLTAGDMANPSPVLAAIPSGTPGHPVVVNLPAGQFTVEPDNVSQPFDITGKSYWELVGGPTTLYFPTYGAATGGDFIRRHVRISTCTDSIFSGINVKGPHIVRHPTDSTRARSTTTDPLMAHYEFQHGFQIGNSARIAVTNCEVLEVGGDGMYILDSDDITVTDLRVEFNGRQGLAGIGGYRWVFDAINVVNAGRFATDFEPIGTFTFGDSIGENRFVFGLTIKNSEMKGGFIFHRVQSVTIRNNNIRRGGIIVEAGNTVPGNLELSQKRSGVRILNNTWPDLYTSPTSNAGPIRMNAMNGLEVRGNTCIRNPADAVTAAAPFVEMLSVPVMGHIIVRSNTTTNFATLFKWRNAIPAGDHVCVTEDVL